MTGDAPRLRNASDVTDARTPELPHRGRALSVTPLRGHSRRALVLLLLVVAVAFAAALRPLHALISDWTARAASLIGEHPLTGALVFVVLSILSAMLAFLSTAALVPITVAAWGKMATFALLWSGWLIGGALSYAIGRSFGRGVVTSLVGSEKMDRYERQIEKVVGFPQLLILQLALPSEIPGYFAGMLRFRVRTYLAALAIAELPFALGAVYLGESFLRGNFLLLILLGITGILLSWSAATLLHRRMTQAPPAT